MTPTLKSLILALLAAISGAVAGYSATPIAEPCPLCEVCVVAAPVVEAPVVEPVVGE